MTDPRSRPDDAPLSGSLPFVEGLQALEGEEMPIDQDAVLDADEVEGGRRPTRTEIDSGDPDVPAGEVDRAVALGALGGQELRDGETDDPGVATQEGITWVPPIDPPVIPDPDGDDPEIAAGTGISAMDQSYEESGTALPEGSDLTERVREALRADSYTSTMADRLAIGTVGSTAVVRGVVDDIDDGDEIAAVIEQVPGIDEVHDETVVEGL